MKKTLAVLLALMLCLSALPAASAEQHYNEFSSYCEAGNLKGAMDAYESFEKKLDKEWASAQGNMSGAMKKNNSKLYQESLAEMKALSGLGMTRKESDMLLSLIVDESDGEKRLENAVWLYENSPYYRPSLSISLTSNGKSHKYDYSSSFSLKPGSEVRLPTQEDLKADSSIFGHLSGWGIMPDEATYKPGETIKMPITDMELYAVWESGVRFSAPESEIDETYKDVKSGETITVPMLLSNDGRYYKGWEDRNTGEFISVDDTEYTVRGKGGDFVSLYSELDCSNQSIAPYTKIPTATQISLSFDVTNVGNLNEDSIIVTISSPEKGIRFLNESAYFRRLPAGTVGKVNGMRFVVSDSVPSGKILPIEIKLEDSEGRVWTETFEFEVK